MAKTHPPASTMKCVGDSASVDPVSMKGRNYTTGLCDASFRPRACVTALPVSVLANATVKVATHRGVETIESGDLFIGLAVATL